MNTKYFTITSFLALFITVSGISQEITEKIFFDTKKELGGEVVIQKSYVKIEDGKSYKIFEIESEENNNYYMDAWVDGVELDGFGSNNYLDYDVLVNNEKQKDKLKPEKNDWESVSFKDMDKLQKSIKLIKGVNQIAFVCDAHVVPGIDFVRLSKDKDKTKISDEKYKAFKKDIEEETEFRRTHPISEKDSVPLSLKSGYTLSNPEGNYAHRMELNFRYTTYKYVSFSAGEQINVSTYAADKYRHVLEVFSINYPNLYTWSNLSSSTTGEATLNITIPYTNTYIIRVRAYYQESQGTANLSVNARYFWADCPISGSGVAHTHTPTTIYNYFTCHLTGDSRLWIEDRSTFPGKICAYNDDYYTSETHDFYWGLSSRVKKNLSVSIGAALVSSYSSYNPLGICDLYIKCANSTIMSYFPNLEDDDAIQSAPSSSVYNCISWSGGIVNYWEWPLSYYSDFYIPGNPLGSFDAFYTSRGYTQSGAYSSNSIVDLWALNGSYTHGSVNKSGNNHPHGYDWESKPGSLMRTFHPRYALDGSSYGSVVDYYIPISSKSTMMLDESIARGLAVIENVEFTSSEKSIISESINSLSVNQKDELDTKYNDWKNTWENDDVAIHSDPRMYANSKEYADFIDYCKFQGETTWPFIFDKFGQGDFFVINALEDLTLENNQDILEKIKKENSLKSTTESGATIVRSPQINAMKYIQELLKSSGALTNIEEDGIIYSNSFDFNVYPNPADASSQLSFNLPFDAKVSAQVIDLSGKVLSVLINEQMQKAGNYSYQLNIPDNFKGTCLVKLRINNNDNVRLIVVQ